MTRLNLNFKVIFFIKVFFICTIICLKTLADNSNMRDYKIFLGPDQAPVKIKIFSSLTCPHCANFHKNVVLKIKKNYVELGKVQLIFIDFPLDQSALNASKLLHCLGKKKQMTFLDSVYENQNQWTSGSDINEINNNLKEMVKILGINSSQFDKWVNDDTIGDKILEGRIIGQEKYSINSTPTIIINEKKFEGSATYKNIKKKIEKIL